MADTTRPRAKRLNQLEKDMIASILNGRRKFNMKTFVANDASDELPLCSTASCMAGHMLAVRKKEARALLKSNPDRYIIGWNGDQIDYATLANDLYKQETGRQCTLDFYCYRTTMALGQVTREDAVKHIKGVHPDWPRTPVW